MAIVFKPLKKQSRLIRFVAIFKKMYARHYNAYQNMEYMFKKVFGVEYYIGCRIVQSKHVNCKSKIIALEPSRWHSN